MNAQQTAEEGPEPRTEAHELSDYQRGYVDGFDAPVNVAARSASPTPEAAGLRERIREGVEGLISRGEWRENVGQRGAPRWRATVARSEVYYIIDHALTAPSQPARADLDAERRIAEALDDELVADLLGGPLESGEITILSRHIAARLTERDHEHYWIDAPEDETLWHCPGCGRTECRHGVEASEDCAECAAEVP